MKRSPHANIEVIVAKNDAILPLDFQPIYPISPPKTLSEKLLKKYKSRQIAAWILQKLFEKYQLDLNFLTEIKYEKNGRPFVACESIDFNISHSGEWVAVIFSHSPLNKINVAIDIEHPIKMRNYQALLTYCATESEIHSLKNISILNYPEQCFYLSWCLREAILKSQGVGIIKLSEVNHIPAQKQIFSPHAPKGILYFYHQLPFYLSYFIASDSINIQTDITLSQLSHNKFESIKLLSPIIYQVN